MTNTTFNENQVLCFDDNAYHRIVGEAPKHHSIDDSGILSLFHSDDVQQPDSTKTSVSINSELIPTTKAIHCHQYAEELLMENGVIGSLANLMATVIPSNINDLIKIMVDAGKPGQWCRVDFNGTVSYPGTINKDEPGIVFDVETFVQDAEGKLGSAMPIVAQAISHKALWMWLHQSWDGTTPYEPQLVSIGSFNRTIVGHSVKYDFARIKERFEFDRHIFAVDTKGMVNCLHGLDGTSRMALKSKTNTAFKQSRQGLGCLQSLVASYNFVVEDKLSYADKKARNIFVEATEFQEFIDNRVDLLTYSMLDVVYTLELFQALYPKFIEWSGGHAVLFGHITLSDALLPIREDREEWINKCDELVVANQMAILEIIKPFAEDLENGISNFSEETEPELFKLDWRRYAPKGYRKKVLPEGWPIRSRFYNSILDGTFKLTGLDLPRLLMLRYKGNRLTYIRGKGWGYYEGKSKVFTKLPHKSGDAKQNVGNPMSSDSLRWLEDMNGDRLEKPLLTSELVDADTLYNILRLLDSSTTWAGFRARVKEKITNY